MTSIFLILIIVATFLGLFTYEVASDATQTRPKASGLFTWLVSGNWPAKVGAILVIVGVGALLRYAFAHIDLPPELKLGSGAVMAAALGFAAMLLRDQPKRRAIHLALAGAAFGVAYLTAYSAYGMFNYINDVNALALLALVAAAAGVFSVSSNAMSVAVLAMVGAYVAPKLAIGTPGVLSVYGYYLAASILSLIMVTLRGWRPLIHLSFLFTLAGALFFGWSGRFYEPEHYRLMQPLLLALTSVHLAMPLLERKYVRSVGLMHFDSAYFILLPLVAAALTLKIAPNLHVEGAIGVGALAVIWAVAAAMLYGLDKSEAPRHAFVALLLAVASALCFAHDLPWLLVGLGLSVALLAVAPKLGWSSDVEVLVCAAALLFGALHVVQSIVQPTAHAAFMNEVFAHRMVASALMMLGAWLGVRRSISLANLLGIVGSGWAVLAILAELLRLQIDFLPQLVYGLMLGAAALSIVISDRTAAYPVVGGFLIFALAGAGWWSAHGASEYVAITYLALTPAVLLGMAWSGRDTAERDVSDFSPSMAIGLLPIALLPWAIATAERAGIGTDLFEATAVMAGIIAAGLSARLWLSASPRWNERIQPLHVYATAIALLWITLFHIERGVWPVAFELLAVIYLIAYVKRHNREQTELGFGIGALMVLSVALSLQAMLLRVFGPDSAVMDASDINKMNLPAVVSLMWAIFGAALAWWGSHGKSRSTWSAGSLLLVAAAVKLVLFDFGSLGQLGNIFAFIAAGVVFLGVAWFAPIPPKTKHVPSAQAEPQPVARPPAPQAPTQAANMQSAPASRESRPEPPSQAQPSGAHQAATPTAATERLAAATQGGSPQTPTAAFRRREEPKGINGLWLVLIFLAIIIATALTVWNKEEHRRRFVRERAQIAEAQRKAVPSPRVVPSAPAALPRAGAAPSSGVPASISASSAAELKNFEFAPKESASENAPRTAICGFPGLKLPSEFSVFAAGAYSGRQVAFQIDQSGHQATQIDVAVNSPRKPVVLMLGAYEPTIWNIGWSRQTQILAVLTSGYHRQAIAGLGKGTPLLVSSYDNRGPCGYFYVASDNLAPLNPLAQRVFGRRVDMVFPAKHGKVVVGEPIPEGTDLLTSAETTPESFLDKTAPIAGPAGLEDAVRKGLLRRATAADMEAWSDAVAKNSPQRDLPPIAGQGIPKPPKPPMFNAYVVLKPFTYPAGLYGGNLATFLIPQGVPVPKGNPGHSAVYDFNTLRCSGPLCKAR